ncbi:MAG: DNA-3-methyladenine glycosylase II [Saprospiraceae bacterium]|jgi:DNA-3-methyladenine glycosylase II
MDELDYKAAIVHLSKDKKFKPYLDKIQLPPRNPSSDIYSGLISSIVSQQLSVKAAATIHARFIGLFLTEYPHVEELLTLSDTEMRSVGLSAQKTKYVRNVALFFQDNNLFDKDWDTIPDDEIISLLTEIKGVGNWTVQMILMFVLKRPDIFPVLDLGIQYGMIEIYDLKQEKKELHSKMEKLSKKWQPHRTVACLYLWAIKDVL